MFWWCVERLLWNFWITVTSRVSNSSWLLSTLESFYRFLFLQKNVAFLNSVSSKQAPDVVDIVQFCSFHVWRQSYIWNDEFQEKLYRAVTRLIDEFWQDENTSGKAFLIGKHKSQDVSCDLLKNIESSNCMLPTAFSTQT